MNNKSRTNWDKVDALRDEDIDTSDIPPLSDEFFAKAQRFTPIKERGELASTSVKPSLKASEDKKGPV